MEATKLTVFRVFTHTRHFRNCLDSLQWETFRLTSTQTKPRFLHVKNPLFGRLSEAPLASIKRCRILHLVTLKEPSTAQVMYGPQPDRHLWLV